MGLGNSFGDIRLSRAVRQLLPLSTPEKSRFRKLAFAAYRSRRNRYVELSSKRKRSAFVCEKHDPPVRRKGVREWPYERKGNLPPRYMHLF